MYIKHKSIITASLRLHYCCIYPYWTEPHAYRSRIRTAHQTIANCPDWPTWRGSQGAWAPAWCDLLPCTQQTNGPLAANREQKEATAANEDCLWEEGRERKTRKRGEDREEEEEEVEKQHRLRREGGWQMEWRGESENERQRWWQWAEEVTETEVESGRRRRRRERDRRTVRKRGRGKTEQCWTVKDYCVRSCNNVDKGCM